MNFSLGRSLDTKIVGGYEAAPGQFTYQVSLQRDVDHYHFCGGTIISSKTVVTAAHCKVDYVELPNMRVMAGAINIHDPNAQRHVVSQFIIHPEYNSSLITSDIAVVIIEDTFEFNDLVQPINLVNRIVPPYEGGVVTSGWGYTEYPYPPSGAPVDLKYLPVNIISDDECAPFSYYLEGKICTLHSKGNGVCSGDSGGPLVSSNRELVGVTSSAFLCATGKPDFFTDVYVFKSFVEQNMQ